MIISRVEDKIRRVRDKNIPEALGFLTPSERAEIEKLHLPRHFFYGGRDAERTFLFLLPDYMEEENFPVEEYLCVLSAKVPFGNPTHRDFLGAILGLGIERECVGDIIVGEESFIYLTRKIAPFVMQNLDKIGRLGVKLKEVSPSSVPEKNEPYEEVNVTVASLRLDALVSGAFNISRSAAVQGISAGLVSVNFLPCENTSQVLSEGDLISFRGRGRAKINSLGGISKKGRQFVNFHTFVKK
ncbi:MAG: RNA-binding protein [Clostridia bacterium]|nr:RNA-binding protein [Clostridia bacterium]